MCYRLEGSEQRLSATETGEILLDATDNPLNLLIDYRVFTPQKVRFLKLQITAWPQGLGVGLIDFTVFAQDPFAKP